MMLLKFDFIIIIKSWSTNGPDRHVLFFFTRKCINIYKTNSADYTASTKTYINNNTYSLINSYFYCEILLQRTAYAREISSLNHSHVLYAKMAKQVHSPPSSPSIMDLSHYVQSQIPSQAEPLNTCGTRILLQLSTTCGYVGMDTGHRHSYC